MSQGIQVDTRCAVIYGAYIEISDLWLQHVSNTPLCIAQRWTIVKPPVCPPDQYYDFIVSIDSATYIHTYIHKGDL